MKRSVNREFEDVMTMVREVIMHQYEQSPNAVAFFLSQGVGSRVDPLLRLTETCTPDSLDHVCSVFEAYRNMVFHIMKQGITSSQFSLQYFLSSPADASLPLPCILPGLASRAPCRVPCTC
jgi:hypothetical protein